MFRCNLPPNFRQNHRGHFRATAVTRGVERKPNKSQHTKLTLEKKFPPPLLPTFELATFRSRVRRSNQPAIPAMEMYSLLYSQVITMRLAANIHMFQLLLPTNNCTTLRGQVNRRELRILPADTTIVLDNSVVLGNTACVFVL